MDTTTYGPGAFRTRLLPTGLVRVETPCGLTRIYGQTVLGVELRTGQGQPVDGELIAVAALLGR